MLPLQVPSTGTLLQAAKQVALLHGSKWATCIVENRAQPEPQSLTMQQVQLLDPRDPEALGVKVPKRTLNF